MTERRASAGSSADLPGTGAYVPEFPVLRDERAATLIYAGVWLVFLVWPGVRILTGGAPLGLQILGFAGLAVFVASYLGVYVGPALLRRDPPWARTSLYSAVMLVSILMAWPSAGSTILLTTPYFVAVWVFTQSLRNGLAAAAVIAVVGLTAAVVSTPPQELIWFGLPLLISMIIVVSMRFAEEREVGAQRLREDLALARLRESLARDVHDLLGHSLTVVTVKTQLARRLIETDPERARAELDDVLELSRRSLGEIRSTVGRLNTPELTPQIAAARIALEAADVRAELPRPGAVVQIPAEQQAVFAWCLREAVTNVVRHSGASRCTVAVQPGRLVVSDDGVGLGAACPPEDAGGNGLTGMRHRVEEAGGRLNLGPAHPGGDRAGTRVEVEL